MFNISSVYKNTCTSYLVLQARYKKTIHWAKLKRKTSPKYKAQNHFDEFYGSVFGNKWEGMKEALLRRSKYVALVNNYGDAEQTMEELTNRGAHCLRKLISTQEEFHKQFNITPPPTQAPPQTDGQSDRLAAYIERQQTDEISSIYPKTDNVPEKLDMGDDADKVDSKKVKEEVSYPNKTLEESIADAQIDESRIIDPSLGMTSESLYQFLPATKLKGMDDFVAESVHYSYYSKEKDFPLLIEPETALNYPEHLKVYTYEMDSKATSFPEPRRCQTGVFNYYPMDCGSVLSVLALGLSAGDRVLDLCSAPGGKALVALQTLLPDVIVCNDISISRMNRIQRSFKDYLFDFETSNKWRERVIFKRIDGRLYTDDQGFDKVLVDVPCTTDRHSMNEDENNIFRPDRIKERLRIPEMQSQLLVNALKLVKVGGTVVYATCSLSPVQNDGVVHMALKHAFEAHSVVATITRYNALKLVKVGGTVVYATCSLSPVQNDGVVHMALKHAFEAHSVVATINNALKLVKVGGTVVYATCSLSPVQNDGVVHMALKHAFEAHSVVATIKSNALKLVKVGGTVVYATCSLSPVQNDGVVHMALKHAFEAHSVVATIKDMSAPFSGLTGTLVLGSGNAAPEYGQLVTPSVGANFGPSYIAKLVRVR